MTRTIGGSGTGRGFATPLAVLAADEPFDAEVINPAGPAKFVFVCDHATSAVPRALGTLGLDAEQLTDHIGWDLHAAKLTRRLSAAMNAPAVLSRWSRLVIDCNRVPLTSQSIPTKSDNVRIPANDLVTEAMARARADAAFWPYHNAISKLLDKRQSERMPTALVAIHSFTPIMGGMRRPWEAGFVYGRDDALARLLINFIRKKRVDLTIGDNEPYKVREGIDYTIPTHGEARGIHCVLAEIRNDEIADDIGLDFWSAMLADCLREVESDLRFVTLRGSRPA